MQFSYQLRLICRIKPLVKTTTTMYENQNHAIHSLTNIYIIHLIKEFDDSAISKTKLCQFEIWLNMQFS